MSDRVEPYDSSKNTQVDFERSLPRRRFFDDMPDRGLFAIVATCGFFFILGLRLYNYDTKIVTALAVAIMFVYGILAYRIPAVALRLDQLGDNIYYLGFIFTLASLSAALIQIQEETDIKRLIGSFGIALFTTIVGIAGRVLFVQMRGDLDEVEESVRRDLVATSAELRAQLNLSLREFQTFHTGVLQATSEARGRLEDALRNQIDVLGEIAEAAADRIKEEFRSNNAAAREISESVRRIGSAADELGNRLTEIQFPNERLEAQLSSFVNRLNLLVEALEKAVERVGTRSARWRRRWFWPFGRSQR
jgi:methyl-accepting chemotaxis protein